MVDFEPGSRVRLIPGREKIERVSGKEWTDCPREAKYRLFIASVAEIRVLGSYYRKRRKDVNVIDDSVNRPSRICEAIPIRRCQDVGFDEIRAQLGCSCEY